MSGALIAEIRRRGKLSQSELGRRAGIPRTVVNAYERGRREPSVTAVERLAAAAGCTVTITPAPELVAVAVALEQVLDLAASLPHDRFEPLPEPPFRHAAR